MPPRGNTCGGGWRGRRVRPLGLSLPPMKIDKRPLVPQRIHRVPREGWSWIERRFLRHHASALSGEAITLYIFLAAVSDKHGVSFYGDVTTADLQRRARSGSGEPTGLGNILRSLAGGFPCTSGATRPGGRA